MPGAGLPHAMRVVGKHAREHTRVQPPFGTWVKVQITQVLDSELFTLCLLHTTAQVPAPTLWEKSPENHPLPVIFPSKSLFQQFESHGSNTNPDASGAFWRGRRTSGGGGVWGVFF